MDLAEKLLTSPSPVACPSGGSAITPILEAIPSPKPTFGIGGDITPMTPPLVPGGPVVASRHPCAGLGLGGPIVVGSELAAAVDAMFQPSGGPMEVRVVSEAAVEAAAAAAAATAVKEEEEPPIEPTNR